MPDLQDCVFCRVVQGELPSANLWADDHFLSILDLCPNTKGMTLVMPKAHYSSYGFDLPEDVFSALMLTSRRIGKALDQALGVRRTALVMEGMGIDHMHVKLYPLHGLPEEFQPFWSDQTMFVETYQGFLSTVLGPKWEMEALMELAQKIREHL